MHNKALIIQNIEHEGPGLLASAFENSGIDFDLMPPRRIQDTAILHSYAALVILGGPASANDDDPWIAFQLALIRKCLHAQKPYLGICLGMQLLAKAMGGSVIVSPVKEVGFLDHDDNPYTIQLTTEGRIDPLFANMELFLSDSELRVFQLHGETVDNIQEIFTLLATGKHCRNQIIRYGKTAYGIQCHFELTESMLHTWYHKDEDLNKRQKEPLISEFGNIKKLYTGTGLQLAHNWIGQLKKI